MTDQKNKNKGKGKPGCYLPSGLIPGLIASYFQHPDVFLLSLVPLEVPASLLRVVRGNLPGGGTNDGWGKIPGI